VQPGGPVVARSGALGLIISFFVPGVGSMIMEVSVAGS
jgi:hypothetical protein